MSESARTKSVRWFESYLIVAPQFKGEDAIVVVMQRLHVDDLVGVLLKKGG